MNIIYGRGTPVQQVVEQAIRESIAENRTVRIVSDDIVKLCADLFAECEDDSQSDGVHTFWGTDLDGNDWSVAVSF